MNSKPFGGRFVPVRGVPGCRFKTLNSLPACAGMIFLGCRGVGRLAQHFPARGFRVFRTSGQKWDKACWP